jgi:eukaryotic-like serine/threonine-protein kinase
MVGRRMQVGSALTGRVLSSRYRLESELGEGGMGAIWRAEHLALGSPVAVKLIDPEIARDESMLVRFLREAKAAASLRSPHVVTILDYGVDEGRPFIVMELLEGENLRHRLKRVGRLDPSVIARVITHVARAVGRAHEAGIIHRDLKPENVFLVRNEDDELAKVLDFGVAKLDSCAPGETHTRTGTLLGTPHYMSPEQVQGNQVVDHRSDLWSMGVIAFECVTGKRPFDSPGLGDLVLRICTHPIPVPSSLAPVPAEFDRWLLKALARDPNERFPSARELAESLRDALGAGRPTTYPDEPGTLHAAVLDDLPTAVEMPGTVRLSSSSDVFAAEPFAPTLVAAGSEFESGSGRAPSGFDPSLPDEPPSRYSLVREQWMWLVGIGCFVLAGAGVFWWLRPRAVSARAPAEPAGLDVPIAVAPIPSASARARTSWRRARAPVAPSSSARAEPDAAPPAASAPPATSTIPPQDAAPPHPDAAE